jgi:uncharacterized membrane protein
MSDEGRPDREGTFPTPTPPPETKLEASNVVFLSPEAIREAAERGGGLQLTIATAHSGPLPSPGTMREYEQVVPGLPKILIDEFQKETQHRRFMQKGGLFGSLSIAALSIIVGAILGYALKSPAAALAVIGPVCGIVGTAQFLEFWLKTK